MTLFVGIAIGFIAKTILDPDIRAMTIDTKALFWAHEGPRLSWKDGVFHIEDLNPEVSIKWAMTPDELRWLGEHAIELANEAIFVSARGSRQ